MKVKHFLLASAISVQGLADCIPAKSFVKYPEQYRNIGSYQRVDPEGRYVLHSSMDYNPAAGSRGRVVLFDLKNLSATGEATPVLTPMNDEVYPIMTDWSLFSSPNHNDGMRYYSLPKIIAGQAAAKPEFADQSHNEYYQSVGELSSKNDKKQIRVTLYSNRRTKDYELEMKDGSVASQKELKTGSICDNITNSPTQRGLSTQERATMRQEIETIRTDYGVLDRELREAAPARDEEIRARQRVMLSRYNELHRLVGEYSSGIRFSSPVLSPDGREVAANVEGGGSYGLKIYKINDDYNCELAEEIPFQTSKVQFSQPVKGKKGQITFTGSPSVNGRGMGQGIYVYDRDSKTLKKLNVANEYMRSGAPGFTKDGKVIFPACRSAAVPTTTSAATSTTGTISTSSGSIVNSAMPRPNSYGSLECGAVIIDPNQIDVETATVKTEVTSCIKEKIVKSWPMFKGKFQRVDPAENTSFTK